MDALVKALPSHSEVSIECHAFGVGDGLPSHADDLTAGKLRETRERLRLETLQRKRLQQVVVSKTQEATAAVSGW